MINKNKILVLASVFLLLSSLFSTAYADNNVTPLWMRRPAISPDGTTVAFTYKGDIFTVPVSGGRALQITTNPSFDTNPIWSPDGKQIAFSSDRLGSMDIYIVSKDGGAPKRLTTHSGSETPIVFKDNNTVLFSSNVMPSAESMQFPSSIFFQVYAVNVEGGRPVMFSSLPMEYITYSPDGKVFLYNDKKGYEDTWRKHHTSSVTRDIWSCEDGKYTQLSTFKGEDRNPVFAPDGKSFYYLSELDGTFNIYQQLIGSTDAPKQITKFAGNPVRFLSVASNGTLCFGYDGEIYTIDGSGNQSKLLVDIMTDQVERDVIKKVFSNGASDMAVSKDGKQIAFIYHGDVYVTSEEYKTTKRITNTPEQERNIDISPDGRSVLYSSERNGLWQVYQTTIVNKDEKTFPYCTEIQEERLTNSDKVSFQASYSPDGKEIAFLEDRTAIMVMNLATKAVRTVMAAEYQYSYSDGDQGFEWSPDGKWILTSSIFEGTWVAPNVFLVDASGNGVMYNLTRSGYADGSAKWVLDGKAMIWASDRAGFRSHGSWGSQYDVYIMFFDLEAYEKFKMNKEDLAIYEEAEKAKKAAEEKAKGDDKDSKKKSKDSKKKDEEKRDEVKPLVLDIENSEYRVARLTVNSSGIGDAVLSLKGDKLYYLTSFEGDMDLWVHDLKEDETRILVKGVGYGQLVLSKDGNSIYMSTYSGIKKIDVASGTPKPVPFESFFDYKPFAERSYIFDHAWQQVKDKFYDPTIRGIDWAGYKTTYAKFLPFINNNYDFSEMLGEMLGELNGSHTGARYNASGATLSTASLGLFYDETYSGDGLKIKEIIKRSPLTLLPNDVKEGCIIEKIDGSPIKAGEDYFPLLEGKSGRKVVLAIFNPSSGKRFDVVVTAIGSYSQSKLLYQRWVDRNREIVEKESDGKIGYIHIEGMDSESFRVLYSELLGRNYTKEAIVVDTRHNGGGWLHDDVANLLSGKEYVRMKPRGQYIGSEPTSRWYKPSCMLICEDNYSDAHGTPWSYKTLNVGKLVGAPVPGTMTAVWWEGQIDRSLVFGIPQMGFQDLNGNYLENVQLDPDILIYNRPEDILKGQDDQLIGATRSLMKK